MPTTREFLLERISIERDNQIKKWGHQKHTMPEWISILTEELGEAAQHACKFSIEPVDQDTKDNGQYCQYYWNQFMLELIHVAAVCVAACEDMQEEYDKSIEEQEK